MEGHRSYKWGDIVTLEYGRRLSGYEAATGEYPVYGTNGMIGWHSEYLCPHAGVVVGRKGAYRGVHYSKTPFFVIDTAFYVKPKVQINLKWAYYKLLTYDINGMDTGSAIPSTNREVFYNLPVTVPPAPVQHRVANILGALDDKIECNRRTNQTLEAMAQALFEHYCLDVEAQTDEWTEGSILDVAELISGGTPKTTEPSYWDGEIKWASAKDVSQCGETFLLKTERQITEQGLRNSATRIVPSLSTVVVARGATTGRLTMFGNSIAMNQTCYALRARDGQHFFLYCWFNNLVEKLTNAAHGSVFDTITTATFQSSKVRIPPSDVRTSFNERVTHLFELIHSNQKESLTLAATRDYLLPKLLSGDIEVKAAEAQVEELV